MDGVTEVIGIKSIMKNAYHSIGELDAVSAFLDPIKQRIEYLELNQNWNQIFAIHDADATDFSLYNQYLGQAGLYGLANKLSQNANLTNYDCAWRLSDWSIVNAGETIDHSIEFDKFHYFALKCLHQRDEIGVRFNIEKAIDEIIKTLKQSSYECTKNIYKELMKLHMLQQIDEFCDVQFPKADNVKQHSPEFIIKKWKFQDSVPSNEFSCREPILAQRITIFKSAGTRARRKIETVYNLKDGIQQMTLNLATECREEGYQNLSQRYLSSIQNMQLTRDMKVRCFHFSFRRKIAILWFLGKNDVRRCKAVMGSW